MLVDARKGVLPQSRRHAYIASLLGIPHVVVAVNKMDLVEYQRGGFRADLRRFPRICARSHIRNLHFIPISALEGDNVVSRSREHAVVSRADRCCTIWKRCRSSDRNFGEEMRFPVQYVVRPNSGFPWVCGAGCVGRRFSRATGDGAAFGPHQQSQIDRHIRWRSVKKRFPPQSVTVCLEDEIDISRGDMLVKPSRMPHVSRRFEATVVWMHTDADAD